MKKIKQFFNRKIDICLVLLALITAVSVIYSMFTFGLTYIHSDNAAEITAIDAIIRHKDLFPEEWIYNNGDVNIMRIQMFLLLPYLMIGTIPVAREVGALLIIVLASFAARHVSKKMFHDNSWLMVIPVCWLMLNERITRDISMYSNMYSSMIIWSCVLVCLLYSAISKRDKKSLVAFSLVEVLVLTGGIRWVAEMTLPLVFVAIWAAKNYFFGEEYRECSFNLTRAIKNVSIVLIPAIIGYGVFKYITIKCDFYVNNANSISIPDSFGEFASNVLVVSGNFYKCFGFDGNVSMFSLKGIVGITSIIVCTVVCYIVPILQLFSIRKETLSVKFFLVFAYAHNAVLVGAAIVSSKLTSYYMVSSIFMCAIISARYIYKYISGISRIYKIVIIAIFSGLVLLNALSLIMNSHGWSENYSRERALAEKLEATGAEKGYATFWNAYTNQMYGDNAYRMGAVSLDDYFISAYYCLVDRTVFDVNECKSFLILTGEENEYYGTVEFFFEKPIDSWIEENYPVYNSETKELDKQKLYVYVYDYDIASRLNNGVQDGIIKPIELVVNDKCEKTFDYIILNNGAITHGPYNNIYRGNYIARIEGTNVDDLSIEFTTEYKDALSYEVVDAVDNCVVINLHVDKSIDDFDIVLKNESGEQIVLQDIRFE